MKIKYIPTGNIFDLPKEECERIYKESPFNYEILDGAFTVEAKAPKSTVAQKVLADEEEQEEKSLNDLTVPELKALCDEKEIEYKKSDKKADLIALLETKEEVSRLHEWKKRPFDCFFSGDDYADNAYWAWEKGELKKLGADMVFFPYTKKRSSSMIRKELQEKGNREGK